MQYWFSTGRIFDPLCSPVLDERKSRSEWFCDKNETNETVITYVFAFSKYLRCKESFF